MADYYGSKPPRQTYEKDLQFFKAANLNHLVGFTVAEKPDCYDLCDRLGILVMLEFPLNQFGPERFWILQTHDVSSSSKSPSANSDKSSFTSETILRSLNGSPSIEGSFQE